MLARGQASASAMYRRLPIVSSTTRTVAQDTGSSKPLDKTRRPDHRHTLRRMRCSVHLTPGPHIVPRRAQAGIIADRMASV